MEYKNYYENLREAQMRLNNTVVTYDGEPVYILSITNHKKDGIFRVYSLPIATWWDNKGNFLKRLPDTGNFTPDDPGLGTYLDKWMEDNPKEDLTRKHINSPAFNKFRPFPLGMWHRGNKTYFLARQPQRHTQQGLTRGHVRQTEISLRSAEDKFDGSYGGNLGGPALRDTILGHYPTLRTCLEGLKDPDKMGVEPRDSVAFHRDFALLKGPLDLIFLAHKTDIVGLVENTDAVLAANYKYLREITENTNCFNRVRIQER